MQLAAVAQGPDCGGDVAARDLGGKNDVAALHREDAIVGALRLVEQETADGHQFRIVGAGPGIAVDVYGRRQPAASGPAKIAVPQDRGIPSDGGKPDGVHQIARGNLRRLAGFDGDSTRVVLHHQAGARTSQGDNAADVHPPAGGNRRAELQDAADRGYGRSKPVGGRRQVHGHLVQAGNEELHAGQLAPLVEERAAGAANGDGCVDQVPVAPVRRELPDPGLELVAARGDSQYQPGRSLSHVGR